MIKSQSRYRLLTQSSVLWIGLCAVCAITSQTAAARPLDEIIESNKLRVVAYLDNAPFSWEDEDGKPHGIDVDIGKAIARGLGVEPEIILRMPGEEIDDDIRVNIWQGPRTGGGVGDIQMHVPMDRELAIRNQEAVLGNGYFHERVVVAIHPEITGDSLDFGFFKGEHKIGVKLATVADYFLMTYEDGALINNVAHHVKPADGAKEFANKEIAALMGVRSSIESHLHKLGHKPVIVEPDMTGIVRTGWVAGMAWKEDSRDLGYAIEPVLEKLIKSGEMAKIFESYGVTYIPPPEP